MGEVKNNLQIKEITKIMKRLSVIFVSLWTVMFGIVVSVGATDVGGIIDTDTTWGIAGSPYVATKNIQVAVGGTLNIEPGVIIKFNPDTGFIIAGELRSLVQKIKMSFLLLI